MRQRTSVEGLLCEVNGTDPVTFAVIPSLTAAVALLASYLPARSASGFDPMAALCRE